ncbi:MULTISPECIES: hypothetical protein [Cetobacterium]|uniref:hypothetical protein n=1 Tax=Cetobacterium TaxID=180162 RepID=UPI001F06E73C|nr:MULTISPECIES: hypothetical protein [Cetobacterium]MCX3066643.1 hypothetical protein [Cetobacterium somerae]UPO98713.1 hypothetical protein MKD34_10560 [Cetobacterium somerae]
MEMNKSEALKIYKQYFNDGEFIDFLESPYIVEDSDDFEDYYPEGTPNLFSKEASSLFFTAYKLNEDLLSVTVEIKK